MHHPQPCGSNICKRSKQSFTAADNEGNMASTHTPLRPALIAACALSALLAGCNEIPGLGPDPRTVAKENEARAIGGACRHAMRGLEDCYALNPKSAKGMVFEGWKDMDAYMREHKIEGTPSVFTQKPATRRSRSDADNEAADTESPSRS